MGQRQDTEFRRSQYGAFNTALQTLYQDDILQLEDRKEPFEFDDSLFEAIASLVYENGGFDLSLLTDQAARDLINETLRVMSMAIDSGLPHEVPETVRYALENNAFVFSGFKTFHSMREIGLSMVTEKGDIKPFGDFLNDVRKINQTYNHHYLYAEYNHAVGSSLMAAKWHDFEQYRTANDGKVREEHALLNGTTLPPSDPFWDKYFPPNGWNCRCTVAQVRKGKYPTSDPAMAMLRGDNCTDGIKQKMFRYNPGKTMDLFPPKHPYKKAPAEAKAIIEQVVRYEQNKALYHRLKEDSNYTDVEFDEITGGVKATHVGHAHITNEKERRFFDGLTGYDLECECQDILFRMGHAAILRDESKEAVKGQALPSLDLEFNGQLVEIRNITEERKDNYGSALEAKNRHLKRFNAAHNSQADAVCLYFHDATFYSEERILNGINYLKGIIRNEKPIRIQIKHVYCVVNGQKELIKFEI